MCRGGTDRDLQGGVLWPGCSGQPRQAPSWVRHCHLTSTGPKAIDQASSDESQKVLLRESSAFCKEVWFLLCLMTSSTLSQDPEPRRVLRPGAIWAPCVLQCCAPQRHLAGTHSRVPGGGRCCVSRTGCSADARAGRGADHWVGSPGEPLRSPGAWQRSQNRCRPPAHLLPAVQVV